MAGVLYGVSVGPGDPDLMTLKAVKCIESAGAVAYPVKARGERGVALDIAGERADLSGKRMIELVFEMSSDPSVRKSNYAAAADALAEALDGGSDVAAVALGDISVYSTYMRLSADMEARGYETRVIPGVTSFCLGAAEARLPLTIGEESLAIVSAGGGREGVAAALEAFDNVVIMKAGGHMGDVERALEEAGLTGRAVAVCNAGMEGQSIGPVEPGGRYGYFTTIIVKRGG
ncbi:MAG: precorrin-2 C(20)-methyltransferase [Candidatus Methanoplasma sp.]|jgi:precorrin-2/cobalt-factor-2 C20-methyltransferase|nr:precorrin-2 C(20)-methyltransferase [Candidatus Methanoplasma sp.]